MLFVKIDWALFNYCHGEKKGLSFGVSLIFECYRYNRKEQTEIMHP